MSGPRPSVSLVGAGKMGLAIGERIVGAGYRLSVYNRTPERAQPLVDVGASRVLSLRDSLRDADVCVTTVSDDEALRAVALGDDGVFAGARSGTTLIDMIYRMLRPGVHEHQIVARAQQLLFEMGSDNPLALEEGMVFALETYCAASDGHSAARIEEEVVVTGGGSRLLTRFPAEDLLVAGRTYVRGADLIDGTGDRLDSVASGDGVAART